MKYRHNRVYTRVSSKQQRKDKKIWAYTNMHVTIYRLVSWPFNSNFKISYTIVHHSILVSYFSVSLVNDFISIFLLAGMLKHSMQQLVNHIFLFRLAGIVGMPLLFTLPYISKWQATFFCFCVEMRCNFCDTAIILTLVY